MFAVLRDLGHSHYTGTKYSADVTQSQLAATTRVLSESETITSVWVNYFPKLIQLLITNYTCYV